MYRCTYCGSNDIVYDPSRGYTVCSNCGSIIDVIYNTDSEIYSRIEDPERRFEAGQKRLYRDRGKGWGEKARLSSIGKVYKIYRSVIGGKRLKKGVFISNEALQDLMVGRKPLKIFDHTHNKVVMELLENSPILKKVIDIMKEYPTIYSRTTRGRVAAAYIAAKMAIRDPVSLSILSKFFNLSRVHLRRIKSAIEGSREFLDKISYIEDLPREIAEADMFIKKHLGM